MTTGRLTRTLGACVLGILLMPGGVTGAGTASPKPADDPVDAYRAFLETLEAAASLDALHPYLSASTRERLDETPDERTPDVLQRLQSAVAPPASDFEVLGTRVIDDRASLVLRTHRTTAGVAVGFETTVVLVREDDRWKVERPEPWSEVSVLPADLKPGADPLPVGPGALPAADRAFDPAAYREVARATGPSGQQPSIEFDRAGRYLAVSDARGGAIRLLELERLNEAWSAQVPHARESLSFRPDGGALAVLSENGWVPIVLPLAPNLGERPPASGYYFTTPVLFEAAASVAGPPNWNGVAYHPQQPILAIAVGNAEDETQGAIVLRSGGDDLWTARTPTAPERWPTAGIPWALTWSPAGDRLAWLGSSQEPGRPIYVKAYPAGVERTMTRADFVPGAIEFSPDGRRLAAAGSAGDGAAVVVWDLQTGEELAFLPGVARAVFAPDGQHVLGVRDAGMMIEPGVADRILVWAIGTPEPVQTLTAFPPDDANAHVVADLAVSPNGRFLAAVSETGEVRLWAQD